MPDLSAPITRPNGKVYRPRKLVACAVSDEDSCLIGVVVFGTHTLTAEVQEMADRYVAWQIDGGYAPANPAPVWWRDGFNCGQRQWMDDCVTGRAGLWFQEIVEVTR